MTVVPFRVAFSSGVTLSHIAAGKSPWVPLDQPVTVGEDQPASG